MSSLFESYDLAGQQLPNRIVMAPMTRARVQDTVLSEDMAMLGSAPITMGYLR
jgi:N-ethylmaleimide reductase